MTHKTKWLLFAPLGLATIGAGASMVHWAGSLKDQGLPASKWLAAGTAALVVFNAGVSLFGRGVVENVLYEVREKPQPASDSPVALEATNTGHSGLN
ncbi:hypothetical protein [Hymenobacter rubidus]|uniref:hypothetical protein n=1 Tax=Hymenobacter rubidus TaxID=1441626 RepID=UPI00191F2F77|nr:hypothetical protein [Hymenobacter rubidus]